ncbi:hypothetical protein J2848_005176 [Azospirillum lipoferum]|uniref:Lipoprotein n=1 Tax=Azospirillum lipoferum TaxID=193 RepID=A0A5A9G394_AZOLI|nr:MULTISPECIES: hypothetical protein [Azospirillum]KAA0589083.1 hypothetical protein FZ942_32125 [Azospirillum lipoferum]MCP1613480.1 hypothetical protein [Azospirillum lipoferum]MDW5533085.1 hypothetical protein [Azospirillum sp. NL1]
MWFKNFAMLSIAAIALTACNTVKTAVIDKGYIPVMPPSGDPTLLDIIVFQANDSFDKGVFPTRVCNVSLTRGVSALKTKRDSGTGNDEWANSLSSESSVDVSADINKLIAQIPDTNLARFPQVKAKINAGTRFVSEAKLKIGNARIISVDTGPSLTYAKDAIEFEQDCKHYAGLAKYVIHEILVGDASYQFSWSTDVNGVVNAEVEDFLTSEIKSQGSLIGGHTNTYNNVVLGMKLIAKDREDIYVTVRYIEVQNGKALWSVYKPRWL